MGAPEHQARASTGQAGRDRDGGRRLGARLLKGRSLGCLVRLPYGAEEHKTEDIYVPHHMKPVMWVKIESPALAYAFHDAVASVYFAICEGLE